MQPVGCNFDAEIIHCKFDTAVYISVPFKQFWQIFSYFFAGVILSEADLIPDAHSSSQQSQSSEDDIEEPPAKVHVSRLAQRYPEIRCKQRSVSADSTRAQLYHYLEIGAEDPDEGSPVHFWQHHQLRMPKLYELAVKCLHIPTTSAPVERVFSRGGILMRLHRTRLSSKLPSQLIFLKCNQH